MNHIDTSVIHKMTLKIKSFVQVSHQDADEFETVRLEAYRAVLNRQQLEKLRDLLIGLCKKMKP